MAKSRYLVLLLLGLTLAALLPRLEAYRVRVPDAARPPKSLALEQNWTPAQWVTFHHTAQGTRLVPYRWFQALEQPCLLPCGRLAEPAYLARFGFIPSENGPDRLPVGFAKQDNFRDPFTGKTYPVLGFTCAACHTGELFYGEYAIRIEGGPANADLGQFQKALGLALAYNEAIPGRYSRFEAAVLGAGATAERKAELRREVDEFLAAAKKELDYVKEHKIYDNPAGFARTDALTRIGNQVFAVDLGLFENFVVSNAPVRFPQIWDAPWLDWIQYNSSIADPLVRNIGEALGVRAMLNPATLENSVDVEALNRLEELVAGRAPYEGLQSPKWPAVLPALDAGKAREGEALYRKHCQGCHLPPVAELAADRKAAEPRYWEKSSAGALFLRVTDVNIQTIGTDAHAALDFRNRTADSGALKKGRLTAAEGLDLVTRAVANRFFDKSGFTAEKRLAWSGYRTPGAEAVRDLLVYKARPLNGAWALGTYLHNGSVPDLYALLSPVEERPARFWVGSKRFDAARVGYEWRETEGAYLFDTAAPGNSNRGHEFRAGEQRNGVIGPLLTPAERWALIEYLKSI